MEIVIKRRDMILVSPNERYKVPDVIGQQMVNRGSAEQIPADILTQEAEWAIKEKKKAEKEKGTK